MNPAQLPAATLSRRSLLLGGAALGGSFLLSGCIGGSPTPPEYETPLMQRLRVFARNFNARQSGG